MTATTADRPRCLVMYASNHGHTGRIAARIAAALRDEGVGARLADVREAPELRPCDFDAAVVGGSLHAGRHQRELVEWCRHHAVELAELPSAFFSVRLTAAEATREASAAVRAGIDELVEDSGWTPDTSVAFAGSLQYREYDLATRLVMRALMHRGGHPTDTSRDHEFTDWTAVERFAREFAAALAPAPAEPVVHR